MRITVPYGRKIFKKIGRSARKRNFRTTWRLSLLGARKRFYLCHAHPGEPRVSASSVVACRSRNSVRAFGRFRKRSSARILHICPLERRRSLLQPSFLAISVRAALKGTNSTRKIAPYLQILDLINASDSKFAVLADATIDTESNLCFQVFDDIAKTIGVNMADLQTNSRLPRSGTRSSVTTSSRTNRVRCALDQRRASVAEPLK